MTKDKKKQILIHTMICVAVFALVFGVAYHLHTAKKTSVIKNVEYALSDVLTQKNRVRSDIVIIAIDDKTLNAYGSIAGWKRDIPAALIEKLDGDESCRPALIGMDIIYSENGDPETDSLFAEVCGKYDNICLVNSYHFKATLSRVDFGVAVVDNKHVEYVLEPYAALKANVRTGFANTLMDEDGIVRRSRLTIEGDRSFAWTLYEMYQEIQGLPAVEPDTVGEEDYFYFSYFGKPGNYSAYSLVDVLEGNIDTRLFRDAIILVGAYAEGMQDSYEPAISHSSQMYGVEIHANIIDALLRGRTQVPMNWVLLAVINGLVLVAFFLILRRSKVMSSIFLYAGMVVLSLGGFIFLNYLGYIGYASIIPIGGLMILGGHVMESYLTEAKRRRQVTGAFKQYVAPEVVEKVSHDKNFKLVLGGENRHIAVLFVDIRGFTTMSESLEPEQVVEILNEYLALTTRSILNNGGTLDKFVGDATMAVFNAPFDLEDYIYKAVCAARDMRAGAAEITEKFAERYGKRVSFGIGVNCGNAVVGNIGCEFRMDYTAIGDTVNTSARLESNAKAGQILISDSVYEALKDRLEVTPVGEIPLKGKSKGVFVYQVDEVK